MPRVTTVLRNTRRAIQDLDLLKVLQSEVTHEQSSIRFQDILCWIEIHHSPKMWFCGRSVSRVRKLLFQLCWVLKLTKERVALMKVCIKKSGLSSILQFDCGVSSKGDNGSELDFHNAYNIQSSTSLDSSIYKAPSYSSLDPHLHDELKNYLVSKGIEESFTNFLLHLHRKAQGQSVNWLRKLEEMVVQGDDYYVLKFSITYTIRHC